MDVTYFTSTYTLDFYVFIGLNCKIYHVFSWIFFEFANVVKLLILSLFIFIWRRIFFVLLFPLY